MKKNQYTNVLQRLSNKSKKDLKLEWRYIRGNCWKQLFQVDDLYVFLSRDPKSRKVLGKISGQELKKAPPQCLERSIADVRKIEFPYAEDIIQRAKLHYDRRWSDLDVGAVSWISCDGQKKKSKDYYRSLQTLVHEFRGYLINTGLPKSRVI